MATVRVLFCLLCSAVVCCGWGAGWGDVRELSPLSVASDISPQRGERCRVLRQGVLAIARQELGVKELTGRNDGKRVEEYLRYVGFRKGNPYCSAYVSWCFGQAGYPAPRTAWSPALFPSARIVKEPKPADVFGIWFPELKRIAHAGFVERTQGDFIQTLEANTNLEGSREGQGVHRRLRHKRTVSAYADWIISKQ